MSSKFIVQRYKRLPFSLFRLQNGLPVKLREYANQRALGRSSFDLRVNETDGLVHPALGDTFQGPNGMSLRPPTNSMLNITKNFKGDGVRVYHLMDGTDLPPGLVILHERDDHFSLQTDEPVELDTFNQRLTEYLETLDYQTKDQFVAQMEDPDDYDS